MGLMRIVLVAALALSVASACKRTSSGPAEPPPPPTPSLGPISVEDLTPPAARPEGVTIDTAKITDHLRRRLSGSGLFASGAPDGGPGAAFVRVRAELALEEVEAEKRVAERAAIRLRIDGRPEAVVPRRWSEDVSAGAETVREAGAAASRSETFQRLVTRTLDELVEGYLTRQRIWGGDRAALGAALRPDAGEMRLEAIRVIASKKLGSEVPTLLALLDDQDETVRDAALGALVELREPRAVGVLTRKRSMSDKREMRKILDAIAAIGGSEAKDYLSFVAEGHEDEELRAMAAEARRRLERREQSGSTGKGAGPGTVR